MEKSEPSLEEIILKGIKDGNGMEYEIMSVARRYNFQIIDVRRALQKLIDNNKISKSGNKFIVNE
jgi:hypothetical protein